MNTLEIARRHAAGYHADDTTTIESAIEEAIIEAIRLDREADDRLTDTRLFLPVDSVRAEYAKKDEMIAGLQNSYAGVMGQLQAVCAALSFSPSEDRDLETCARRVYAERDTLARWKREALVVQSWWRDIDDFVRQHPETKLGSIVPHRALELLRERDEVVRKLAEQERLHDKGP